MFWLICKTVSVLLYKGITYTDDRYCPNITFDSEISDYSLKQIRSTGSNIIALVVTQYQDDINSTDIYPVFQPIYQDYYTHKTATIQSLRSAIRQFKRLGGKVMLKPHIDLIQDNNRQQWRGDIGKHFDDNDWQDWFQSYTTFILKYAYLAQQQKVEILSISCQLIEASKKQIYWRNIIKNVRKIYKGNLTDSANWSPVQDQQSGQDTQKKWWDAVDIIGIDAYYPICQNITNPTLQQLLQGWKKVIQRFNNLTTKYNKKLMLTQIGYCSGNCSRKQFPVLQDFNRQARMYQAALMSILNLENVIGIFWWSWNTDSGYLFLLGMED